MPIGLNDLDADSDRSSQKILNAPDTKLFADNGDNNMTM